MRIRKAVFPVAGLGTRFLPATKAMPKEMLPLVDKPLIQYAVEEAAASGIEQFIFVTGRGKTAIEDHFDTSFELETILQQLHKTQELAEIKNIVRKPGQVIYIRQQEPLGLGHAVWCARHLIQDEPFAVLLADDFILNPTPCLHQLMEGYTHGHRVAVMQVPRDQVSRYGILDLGGNEPTLSTNLFKGSVYRAQGVVEKPTPEEAPSTWAIVGRYLLDPRIFDFLSPQSPCQSQHQRPKSSREIQLTNGLGADLTSLPLEGIPFEGKRFDCGSKEGFLLASLAVGLNRTDLRDTLKGGIEALLSS